VPKKINTLLNLKLRHVTIAKLESPLYQARQNALTVKLGELVAVVKIVMPVNPENLLRQMDLHSVTHVLKVTPLHIMGKLVVKCVILVQCSL